MQVQTEAAHVSQDFLAMISNDSPTDLGGDFAGASQWGATPQKRSPEGGGLWQAAELFGGSSRGHSPTACANGKATLGGPPQPLPPQSLHELAALPGGALSVLTPTLAALGLGATSQSGSSPQTSPPLVQSALPPMNGMPMHHGYINGVSPMNGMSVQAQQQQQQQQHASSSQAQAQAPHHHLHHHQHQQSHQHQHPQQHPHHHHHQQQQQQQHQQQQQQQQALVERDEEIVRLQKLVCERDDELVRRDAAAKKAAKAREAELASLKTALTKEKEEKLAKLSAAHNKRVAGKEDELAQLRASLQRERDKELDRIEGLHTKQLKARDDEVSAFKASLKKEGDERVNKLQATIKELKASAGGVKELKASLAAKDAEIAGLRKQLGAAQKIEDELRKQQASTASAMKAEEKQKETAIARLKGSIEQSHTEQLKRQNEEHELALAARHKEVAALTNQLKQMLAKYQGAQSALQADRDKVREALLNSRAMAEVSMEYSSEREAQLVGKVEGGSAHECTVEELHWLMTRTFRSWLTQSYSECDEVRAGCDCDRSHTRRPEPHAAPGAARGAPTPLPSAR